MLFRSVVDCLRSARDCLAAGTYEQVVKAAIVLGHDTDTTAAVAGGIAGLREGLEGIPERWRRALRERELVEPLLAKLLAHQQEGEEGSWWSRWWKGTPGSTRG